MDTPLPAPVETLTPAEAVHLAQATKVLDLMITTSLTEVEACKQVGIDRRTFQRTVVRQDMLNQLRANSAEVLVSAVGIALQGYLEGLEEMRKRLKSPTTPAPAVAKITAAFGDILQRFAGVVAATQTPGQPADGEAPAPAKAVDTDFTIEGQGPITVRITAHDGVPVSGPVIVGTARPAD